MDDSSNARSLLNISRIGSSRLLETTIDAKEKFEIERNSWHCGTE